MDPSFTVAVCHGTAHQSFRKDFVAINTFRNR